MLFGRMPGDKSLGRTPLVTALPAPAGGAPFFYNRFGGQRLQPYGAPIVAAYRGGPVPQLSSVSPVVAAPAAAGSPAAAAAPDWLVGRDRERRIARATGAAGTAQKGGAEPDAENDRNYYDLAERIGGIFAGDHMGKLDFDGVEYVQLAGVLLQEIAKWAQGSSAGKTAEAKPSSQSETPSHPALPKTMLASWIGSRAHGPSSGFRSNPPSLSPTGPKAAPVAPRPVQARRPSYSLLV